MPKHPLSWLISNSGCSGAALNNGTGREQLEWPFLPEELFRVGTAFGTWHFYLISGLYLFGTITPALRLARLSTLAMPPPVLPRLLLCAQCSLLNVRCALSPLLLPGLVGYIHTALQCGWPASKNRHTGVSFCVTVPARPSPRAPCLWDSRIRVLCSCMQHIKNNKVGFVWFQVSSDREDKLAGSGNAGVFWFPLP